MIKLSEEEKKIRSKASKKRYRDTHRDELNERARTCHAMDGDKKRAQGKIYHAANKERINARQRVNCAAYKGERLKRAYGITLAEYQQMLEIQDGRCKICGKKPGKRMLDVDHCHKTNKVRGLLCSKCNIGLGQFNDSLGLLLEAALYLEENS